MLLGSGSLLAALLATGSLAAQAPYGAQPYPTQPYPAQGAPAQSYPQQPYPQPYPQQPQPYNGQPMMQPPPAYGAPAPTSAANIGDKGQFVLSVDRLFGLYIWSSKIEGDNNVSQKDSGTAINLLFGDNSEIVGPYATPRLGFDYTVAQSMTIGGAIGVISRSGTEEITQAGTTTSQDRPSVTGFAFAPRFGYILPINQLIALWFRGGITYFTSKLEQKSTNGTQTTTFTQTTNGFALDLEPQLIITPVSHFGLSVGLLGDIPLSGSVKVEQSGAVTSSQDLNNKITNFGITFGLLGII
jgi:hypothetical protein